MRPAGVQALTAKPVGKEARVPRHRGDSVTCPLSPVAGGWPGPQVTGGDPQGLSPSRLGSGLHWLCWGTRAALAARLPALSRAAPSRVPGLCVPPAESGHPLGAPPGSWSGAPPRTEAGTCLEVSGRLERGLWLHWPIRICLSHGRHGPRGREGGGWTGGHRDASQDAVQERTAVQAARPHVTLCHLPGVTALRGRGGVGERGEGGKWGQVSGRGGEGLPARQVHGKKQGHHLGASGRGSTHGCGCHQGRWLSARAGSSARFEPLREARPLVSGVAVAGGRGYAWASGSEALAPLPATPRPRRSGGTRPRAPGAVGAAESPAQQSCPSQARDVVTVPRAPGDPVAPWGPSGVPPTPAPRRCMEVTTSNPAPSPRRQRAGSLRQQHPCSPSHPHPPLPRRGSTSPAALGPLRGSTTAWGEVDPKGMPPSHVVRSPPAGTRAHVPLPWVHQGTQHLEDVRWILRDCVHCVLGQGRTRGRTSVPGGEP